MESVKQQSACAKRYQARLKEDPEFYASEKKRVAEYMKNRYANDEEYRKKTQEQKRIAYHRRKAQNSVPVC